MREYQEWVQREWTQPDVNLYRDKGDFYELSALYPDFKRRVLKRAPAWSSLVAHAGLTSVRGLFYDEANTRYVLLGQNASNYLSSLYFNSSWVASGVSQLTTATALPGGLSMYNYAYFGDKLYVIIDSSDVYRCNGYSSTMASFYAGSDAWMLVPYGGRLYMITAAGNIYQLNDAGDAFASYLAPVATYDPLWAGAFRGYLCVVGQHSDGRVVIHRVSVPSATVLHEAGRLPPVSPTWTAHGSLFAVHDDVLYFSPGPYTDASGVNVTQFWTWNGSRVERLTELRDTAVADTIGLTTWRGELIYYELANGVAQVFKVLVGDHFVDFAPLAVGGNLVKLCAGLGIELVVTGKPSTTEGIYRLPTSGSLQDGHLITSKLDMDKPGRLKLLTRITVLLDGAATDFKVGVRYRVDEATSWTGVVTGNNLRRVTIDLAVEFYTVQFKVELDDDTGNDEDIAIESVSCLYVVGDAG